MKYALVIPDGCADEPQPKLGGRTPLQAARTPNMDRVAQLGLVGRADNVPASMPSGSDVATMSLFGYDPLVYHTGRAPLEAAAQGIPLGLYDWAVRCNFVTIAEGVMRSFTAGQIPNDLARELIDRLRDALGTAEWEFHAGVSYRNLLIHRGSEHAAPFDDQTHTTPPHDLTDQPIAKGLPQGKGADTLMRFMRESQAALSAVARNASRTQAATQIWLWGQGKRPALQNFQERFGVTGAMITAVDLLRGIAALLGWTNIAVPGATGYLDTDYAAKGRYAIEALDHRDFVVVHVEATDEASHEGSVEEKVHALEMIDEGIVGPLLDHLLNRSDYRLLISPDHPTFLRTKTHSHGFVPFAACGTGLAPDLATAYDEVQAARSSVEFPRGCDLMPWFLARAAETP
ncbi:MAG: cofactor-independent phosphoglycerate mutase [Planctomycetota bacterium]|nr:cofactor-independent phosphoglycerate mutase [Planctomycetota bacterium]